MIKNSFLKKILIAFVIVLFGIQLSESCSWLAIKLSADPRETSSDWIIKNLPKGTLIGIENIPVYQQLPDVVLREFYSQQYKIAIDANFRYKVIDSKSASLPRVSVITNDDFDLSYLRKSDKKNLVSRLKNDGYKIVAQFQPNFNYFKLFNDEFEYFVSGLVQAPNTVSIYEKQK
jgi:hypothetical protein